MTTEFYPGSKTPRRQYPAGEPEAAPALDGLLGEGKKYKLAGRVVTFYTLGQLASALGRKPVTIRRWEAEGVIPTAVYSLPGADGDPRGKRRLYTREQVEGVVQIAREEGILTDLRKSVRKTQFSARVRELFKAEAQ